MKKAVFLDRDGTLIIDLPYNADPEKIYPVEKAFDALKHLQKLGFTLVVVTNQSGVARGFYSSESMDKFNRQMAKIFLQENVSFAGLYSCIHSPDDSCGCRKPAPGMILQAAKELDICVSESWMIGDKISDVQAGIAAGCKDSILISKERPETYSGNFLTAPSLWQASQMLYSDV